MSSPVLSCPVLSSQVPVEQITYTAIYEYEYSRNSSESRQVCEQKLRNTAEFRLSLRLFAIASRTCRHSSACRCAATHDATRCERLTATATATATLEGRGGRTMRETSSFVLESSGIYADADKRYCTTYILYNGRRRVAERSTSPIVLMTAD